MRRFGLLAALGLARPAAGGHPFRDRMQQRLAERRAALEEGIVDEGLAVDARFVLPAGAAVERDLNYGDDPAQRLDVYRPVSASGAPVMLFVHGGGWRRGDKAMPRMVANKVTHWVGQGHVFVSTNYRMLPDADPLEQADDVARALAFVQAQAGRWGGDPARVVVIGHSAGAHLVSLITADTALAAHHGAQPWLATVAIDSAALDIEAIMTRRHYRFYDPVFGSDPTFWRLASPMHRLQSRPVAPMLLICSSQRDDSSIAAHAFAAKAATFGGRAEVLALDMNHMELNDGLGLPGDYTAGVDAFLHTLAASRETPLRGRDSPLLE